MITLWLVGPRQLHLNINVNSVGRHDAAWRLLDDPRAFIDVDFFCDVARIAERGLFDAVFFADQVVLRDEFFSKPFCAIEPTVLLTAIGRATERVGLVATASTTFNDPYNLTRRLASLDHVTRGRAAWNIVTTRDALAAANFGTTGLPERDDRYARADEFVQTAIRLWDSWEDDAIVGDAAADVFIDRSKVHNIDHAGDFFTVRGPLGVPRSPQGRPVLVQAGSSGPGRELAAKYAEIVFTAQTTDASAREFYDDIKARAARFGRAPESVHILPGLFPIVGSTEGEARARKARFDALLDVEHERLRLAGLLEIDPEVLVLDRPLPLDRLPDPDQIRGARGFFDATVNLATSNELTVRELLLHNPGGHRLSIGTPEQIADDIEHWFRSRLADGFNLNADSFPTGFADFVDHVVPELQRRGIYRREYTGTTLRDHLGLERPASIYAPAALSA